MSDKPRIVPVIVTDPDVTEIYVEQWSGKNVNGPSPEGYTVFLPEDDQLREYLRMLTWNAIDDYPEDWYMARAARHVRAAFGLDPEDGE